MTKFFFGKGNLTHLTTELMFSGQRFAILAIFWNGLSQDVLGDVDKVTPILPGDYLIRYPGLFLLNEQGNGQGVQDKILIYLKI